MEQATAALLHADLRQAEEVIAGREQVGVMQRQAEDHAFKLLALQSPVAGDLRAVLSCLQNVADAERMGGLALHVVKIRRQGSGAVG